MLTACYSQQRIGRDSFREYNACFLCLQTARDPVACPEGHLACRECMYESILQQKQNIKREQRLMEQKVRDLENLKARETEEAKQALLDDFEKTQTSMLGRRAPRAATATASTTENSINSSPSSAQKNGSGMYFHRGHEGLGFLMVCISRERIRQHNTICRHQTKVRIDRGCCKGSG